jgi:plastocyanin
LYLFIDLEINMKKKLIVRGVLLILIIVIGAGYLYERMTDKPTVITLPEDQLPTMTVNKTTISDADAQVVAPPKNVDVGITEFAFKPDTVQVAAGGTVRWFNFDKLPHDVQGDGFSSGLIYHGYSYSFTFTIPGTYNYVSSIHSYMQGTIIVV